ncbi:hypothetical protein N657DRAFT_667019 [Parathielavia appendiculata]|uniref:Uncharacterized protein n=1 Tax=Parathielavia appendiculata TaxID=2587402 RepID=A0AAN6TQC9_9PEZI|nr:hypothetical protein N657DRAFT_667019 [Parathielavia appendiculata]
MAGTIIITGANGSLGLGFVQAVPAQYPTHTLVATVRNASAEADTNMISLQIVVSKHPESRILIESLDLGSIASVRSFADVISTNISDGERPLISAIVCNVFTWSLSGEKRTSDGYEATFQVSHLPHMLLVLSFSNPLAKLRAGFPGDLEHLVHPPPDKPDEVHDKGFQRYSTAKIANVVFMHNLNRRLRARVAVRRLMSVVNIMMPLLRHLTALCERRRTPGGIWPPSASGLSFMGKGEACWRWAGMSSGETVL